MATEDLTTYTEVDPNSHITVITTRSTFANLDRNEDAYVYDDKGVGHFDGDYEHLIDVYLDSSDVDAHVIVWGLANLVDDARGIDDAGGDEHLVRFTRSHAGYWLRMDEMYAGTEYAGSAYGISLDTTYYLKIKRDESVGTYGTLYLYIYSDAARTNLLATQTLTLHEKEDFRYIYVTQALNTNNTPYRTSGYSENLDLQEVVVVPRSFGFVVG